MKRIFIDISPMVSSIFKEWDGEQGKTFKNYLKRKENTTRITNKINEIMNTEKVEEIKIDLNDRSIKVTFNNFTTLEELYTITNKLTINDLMAYKI